MERTRFNKVVIIQSLPDGDLRSGAKIREDMETFNDAFQRRLSIDLIDARSKKDFIDLLMDIDNQIRVNPFVPVLQIDAHGSSDHEGLILSSGDFCAWSELKPLFTQINIATRLNLLIVLSLCYGAHFAEHLTPPDRALCWGVVGPTKPVRGDFLVERFSAFYKEILDTGDGNTAVDNLNRYAPGNDIDFFFTTATEFFKNVFSQYIKKRCSIKAYDDRARKLRKRLRRNKVPDLPTIGNLRRQYTKSQRVFFEKFRQTFFMIDLYPENAERFTLQYSDVL